MCYLNSVVKYFVQMIIQITCNASVSVSSRLHCVLWHPAHHVTNSSHITPKVKNTVTQGFCITFCLTAFNIGGYLETKEICPHRLYVLKGSPP